MESFKFPPYKAAAALGPTPAAALNEGSYDRRVAYIHRYCWASAAKGSAMVFHKMTK
jgi:hypothetical protein